MNQWKGKVAVVTGASAGIGAAIVEQLVKHGVTVVGMARRKDRVQALAESNKKQPGKIYAVECDVMSSDSITKAFEWVEKNLGGVDILVNNAGTVRAAQVTDLEKPDSDYTLTIETNLTGLVLCTRRALKTMKERPAGYIININSVGGHISAIAYFAQSGTNVYTGTKHAVTNLTDTIRLELACAENKKIRISSLSPGAVTSEFLETAVQSLPDPAAIVAQRRSGGGPSLEPSDVADAVVYLLSTKPTVNISELIIHPTGEKF